MSDIDIRRRLARGLFDWEPFSPGAGKRKADAGERDEMVLGTYTQRLNARHRLRGRGESDVAIRTLVSFSDGRLGSIPSISGFLCERVAIFFKNLSDW